MIVISWHVGGFPDKVGSVDKHWLCTSIHHMYRMGLLHLLISFPPACYLAKGGLDLYHLDLSFVTVVRYIFPCS
jgi:hypothetical protein